jgi:TonB family protein
VFDKLVESNPDRRGRGKANAMTTMWSIVLHAALIYAAVMATMRATEAVLETVSDTMMMFIEEPEEQPEEEEPPPVITSLNPPPKGFQTLAAPIDIPTEIPPINLNERFDPRDYTGVGVEGGVFSGVEGGTGPVDLTQVFAEAVVDEVPEQISCPRPPYPRMMQQAQIEGSVLLEFIVDQSGHAEAASIRPLNSTNRAFETPAREMIEKCLFRPGRVRGQAVKVLVRMPINFVLAGR